MDKNDQAQKYVKSLPKIKIASDPSAQFKGGISMDEQLKLMIREQSERE